LAEKDKFLHVDECREVHEELEEMDLLAKELASLMGQLEEGLEKDRKNTEEVENKIGEVVEASEETHEILSKNDKEDKGEEEEEKQEESEDSEKNDEDELEDDSENDEASEDEDEEEKSDEKENTEEDQNKSDSEEGSKEDAEEDENRERKKELADDLGLDNIDIENYSIEELEDIKDEKDERERIISDLNEKGMDEESLREASTDDLRTIREEMEEEGEEDSKTEEERDEMREEAEEDLDMLMGAVRWDEEDAEEDEGKSLKEKFNDFEKSISEKLSRHSDEEEDSTGKLDPKKVNKVLDKYRDLDSEEASIKVAHVMKGFLEKNLGIEKELTYQEMADHLPEDNEDFQELSDFFEKLNREQYTGQIDVRNIDEIIDTCERILKNID
jgi:hypothetical protein